MGTQHIKMWETCVQALNDILQSDQAWSDMPVDVPNSLRNSCATACLQQIKLLTPCPKATWKKLVFDMQV